MGNRNRKNKKTKKVELSKTERFVQSTTNKLFICLAIFPFCFVFLDLAFSFNIPVSVELYFLIIYAMALLVALFICFGMYNSLRIYKVWGSKNVKESLLLWLMRGVLLVILILDIKLFVFPMTLDMPRLATENYKKINGAVKSIETNDYKLYSGSSKGKWYEKIKYIYFTEQISGKTIKIVFHANANNPDIGYNIKTIYY